MTAATLPVPTGDLAYHHAGAGPLVVLSHALGPVAWGPLDRLARSCTVAIPDWQRSTVPADTMSGLDWFEALVASLGSDSATLCAWSMAGPAAILYAATRPARLSRLVLVDVAGLGEGLPPLQLRDLAHLLLSKLRGHPTRGFVRALWRNWVHREDFDTTPLVEASYRFFRDQEGALAEPSDEDEEDDAIVDALSSIEVPTLVLAGRHSTVLGPRHGKVAAALLPRSRLLVLEGSSHALQLEEPEAFQDAVAAFVTDGEEPGSGCAS